MSLMDHLYNDIIRIQITLFDLAFSTLKSVESSCFNSGKCLTFFTLISIKKLKKNVDNTNSFHRIETLKKSNEKRL